MPTLLANPVDADGITRRQFTAGAAASLLVAACGTERAAAPPPGSAAPPRRVKDFFGNDVEIPAAPERVVAADDIALGNLLDLGVRPSPPPSTSFRSRRSSAGAPTVSNGISLPAAHAILDDVEATLLAGR